MTTEQINAASTAFAAFAAFAAAVIGGLSIYQLRRMDRRARQREAVIYDDALQNRLDALIDDLRKVMGTPDDGIPRTLRETLMRFFVLYSDAFAADRDELLGSKDNAQMLDEFDFWAQQPAGRSAWEVFAAYSWPKGFREHVEQVFLEPSPYQVHMSPASLPWEIVVEQADPAQWTQSGAPAATRLTQPLQCGEVLLRMRPLEKEFPPAYLDKHLSDATSSEVQKQRREIFARWLGTLAADRRWLAVMGSRAVGHVCVGPPADYLATYLSQTPDAGLAADQVLEVRHLFIDPALQQQGCGRRLLETAAEYVRSTGKTPVLVVLPASGSAVILYEKLGWREIGRFTGKQGVNIVFRGPGDTTPPPG